MLKILGPRELHQLQYFEELREVQVLLTCNNIDHLVKFVLLIPLDGSSDISGQVDTRAI